MTTSGPLSCYEYLLARRMRSVNHAFGMRFPREGRLTLRSRAWRNPRSSEWLRALLSTEVRSPAGAARAAPVSGSAGGFAPIGRLFSVFYDFVFQYFVSVF